MSDMRAQAEQLAEGRCVCGCPSVQGRCLHCLRVDAIESALRGVRDAERRRAGKIARERFGFPAVAEAIEGAEPSGEGEGGRP